jgi:hypothetical protein
MRMSGAAVGDHLRGWRVRRRMSQLDLAAIELNAAVVHPDLGRPTLGRLRNPIRQAP